MGMTMFDVLVFAGYDVEFGITEYTSFEKKISSETQQTILDGVNQYGASNIVVIIGQVEEETIDIVAKTLTTGDPTNTGPLSNLSLNLKVYHMAEREIKKYVGPDMYDEQLGLLEEMLILNNNAFLEQMVKYR